MRQLLLLLAVCDLATCARSSLHAYKLANRQAALEVLVFGCIQLALCDTLARPVRLIVLFAFFLSIAGVLVDATWQAPHTRLHAHARWDGPSAHHHQAWI